jgi:hypothetical protein
MGRRVATGDPLAHHVFEFGLGVMALKTSRLFLSVEMAIDERGADMDKAAVRPPYPCVTIDDY